MSNSPRAHNPNVPGKSGGAIARTGEQPVMKAREGKVSILDQVALRLEMDPMDLQRVLKATVFQKASNEEFAALLVVCNAYGLNPITKEIYAFPTKGGGIMPMVSIDGWIRIVNEHPKYKGVVFNDIADEEGKLLGVECTMYRTDRDMPTRIVEYLAECKQNTDPWKNMPARMNRHKAFIQCARYTFGFSGIYDDSEASIMAREMEFAPPMVDAGPPPRRTKIAPPAAIEGDIARDEVVDPQTGEVTTAEPEEDGNHPALGAAERIMGEAAAVANVIDLNSLRARSLNDLEAMGVDVAAAVYQAFDNAEKRLKGGK